MFGVIGLLAALVRYLPTFGGEDPIAGNPWHHERITWDAAYRAGWATGTGIDADGAPDKGSAAAALAWHADYVDSYAYNPLWWVGGGIPRFRAALLAHDDLKKVHFDDCITLAQLRVMWERYLGGTVAGLVWAATGDDVAAARHVVGVGLHASQDFYAHSTWVDDPSRRHRTWFDLRGDAEGSGLYAGTYELPDHLGIKPHGKPALDCGLLAKYVPSGLMSVVCSAISPASNGPLCHRWRECQDNPVAQPATVAGVKIPEGVWMVDPGIALDSSWQSTIAVHERGLDVDSAELFQVARNLATEHSYRWLVGLNDTMITLGLGDFWSRVMSEPRADLRKYPGPSALTGYLSGYGPDIDMYENPSNMLWTFLSAGDYPPDPTVGDEGWYLRIQIRTADQPDAGTDGDVTVTFDGAIEPYLLDHMHERNPGGGGPDENRLLEFNDFERGADTPYLIGPLAAVPRELVISNVSATWTEIVAGAWHDLMAAIEGVLDTIGDIVLDLVAGHANFVGNAQQFWTWQQLSEISAGSRQNTFTLVCDGGEEGHFEVLGYLDAVAQGEDIRVDVHLTELRCIAESKFDRGSDSDEPFVLWLVNSPLANRIESAIAGPFEEVDIGESRPIGQVLSVDIPRYGPLIVPAVVWESDDEGASGREKLQAAFLSRYGDGSENMRSNFLDAAGRAVAADWLPVELTVFAFRRGAVVQTQRSMTATPFNQWLGGGDSVRVSLVSEVVETVRVPHPVSLPAVVTAVLAAPTVRQSAMVVPPTNHPSISALYHT